MSDLISRAEAKEALRERFKRIPTYAIWAMYIIDELPIHPTPSNTLGALDCVERQAAIDAIVNTVSEVGNHDNSEVARYGATFRQHEILDIIESLPSVQPRKGKWIYGEHESAMCDGYRCNKCGFFVPWDYQHKFIDFINEYNFCPNCGCRMEEGGSE